MILTELPLGPFMLPTLLNTQSSSAQYSVSSVQFVGNFKLSIRGLKKSLLEVGNTQTNEIGILLSEVTGIGTPI